MSVYRDADFEVNTRRRSTILHQGEIDVPAFRNHTTSNTHPKKAVKGPKSHFLGIVKDKVSESCKKNKCTRCYVTSCSHECHKRGK